MTKNLYIIRGLPGSGKTTMADALVALAPDKVVRLEADDFFIDDNGEYQYDASSIKLAHYYCKQAFYDAISKGFDIIISNTSVKPFEWNEYKSLAEQENYKVHIIIKENHHNGVTSHGVPIKTIMRMKSNFTIRLLPKKICDSSFEADYWSGKNRLGYE